MTSENLVWYCAPSEVRKQKKGETKQNLNGEVKISINDHAGPESPKAA